LEGLAMTVLRTAAARFAQQYPWLSLCFIVALAAVVAILFLYQIERPEVVYENF
jgi:hypothetical protein